jgi:hypothetical protein
MAIALPDTTTAPMVEPVTEEHIKELRAIAFDTGDRVLRERIYLVLDQLIAENTELTSKLSAAERTLRRLRRDFNETHRD